MGSHTEIDEALLRQFSPMDMFSDAAMEELIPHCQVEEVEAGAVLFREGGSDNSAVFVISGAINLESMLGDEGTVMGETPQAAEALSDTRPRVVTATAKTDAVVLYINSDVLGKVTNKDQLPCYDVAEVEVDTLAATNKLFFAVLQDVANDKIELPMLPDIAIKVREAVADDDSGPADVAKIIQADPSITAKVIQVANSARFGGMAQVDNVQQAVMRLGLSATRELVFSLTMRNIFNSNNPDLKHRMFEAWYQSCRIASIATVLARETKGFQPDRALLVGLVCRIGVVPILKEAEKYPELTVNPLDLEDCINQLHGEIGYTLLSRWNFPEDIAKATQDCEDWHRDHEGKPDYADLLIVATIHSHAGTSHKNDYPRLYEVAASKHFDLGEITEEHGSTVLHELQAEIDAELQTLTG